MPLYALVHIPHLRACIRRNLQPTSLESILRNRPLPPARPPPGGSRVNAVGRGGEHSSRDTRARARARLSQVSVTAADGKRVSRFAFDRIVIFFILFSPVFRRSNYNTRPPRDWENESSRSPSTRSSHVASPTNVIPINGNRHSFSIAEIVEFLIQSPRMHPGRSSPELN